MKKIMMLVLAAALIAPLFGCKEKTTGQKAADVIKDGKEAVKEATK